MKERPIIFNADMVRAILDGRKTQTRRPVKPIKHPFGHWLSVDDVAGEMIGGTGAVSCPFGLKRQRLWVRETWNHANYPGCNYEAGTPVFYRADYLNDPWGADWERNPEGMRRKWRPSIHMPRTASRINLEITEVRVERLQDISGNDAIAEGLVTLSKDCGRTWKYGLPDSDGLPHGAGWAWRDWEQDPRCAYKRLWESIYGADSWAENPWVWVVEFRREGGEK